MVRITNPSLDRYPEMPSAVEAPPISEELLVLPELELGSFVNETDRLVEKKYEEDVRDIIASGLLVMDHRTHYLAQPLNFN